MRVQVLSHIQLLATPWTVARQAPWDFPYKNTGVSYHFILQVIFLTQGLKSPGPSALTGGFFTTDPCGKLNNSIYKNINSFFHHSAQKALTC